jgi:hypothetical protein
MSDINPDLKILMVRHCLLFIGTPAQAGHSAHQELTANY